MNGSVNTASIRTEEVVQNRQASLLVVSVGVTRVTDNDRRRDGSRLLIMVAHKMIEHMSQACLHADARSQPR